MYFNDTVNDHTHREKSETQTSYLVLSAPKSACFLVVNLYIKFPCTSKRIFKKF